MMNLDEIMKLDQEYFMPVFGERFPTLFTHGEGVYLFDRDGKKYTDFLAGIAVNCLGYGDEGLTKAVTEQFLKLPHICNYFYNETQSKLAELLCKATGMSKVFFANSGAEANEGALKLARSYFFKKNEHRMKFVTLNDSFHGRTLATLAATGQPRFHEAFEPLIEKFCYIDSKIEALNEVDDQTCAVIIECIQGEGGVLPLTQQFADALKAHIQETGALLIVDEIQTGMGRTGTFLCCEQYGLKPDIVTLAKSFGGGVPAGAVIANKKTGSSFGAGDHGSTFGGNHLACAAAYYVLTAILERGLIERCDEIGKYFISRLEYLKKFPFVLDVRGKGLMLGVQLDEKVSAKIIQKKLLNEGFVICSAGMNTLRFLPPYIIEEQHIDALINKLESILREI